MKTKTTLIIVATLIVGFVLGFLSHGYFVKSRFDRFRELKRPGMMKNFISERLDLTDEQIIDIEPILEKYESTFREKAMKARENLMSTMKQFNDEIKPYLTESQIEKLEKDRRAFRRGFPPGPRFD